jgi:hypothetical protein
MTKRIMRRFKIMEISGVDKPAQKYARAVIMKAASNISETPMTDRLNGLIDNYRRLLPHLQPEQHYAMAWGDLSLADRNQVRAEESGEFQGMDLDMSKQYDTDSDPMVILKAKAAELRKIRPEMSESQAFSKVYQDRANAELVAAERRMNRPTAL